MTGTLHLDARQRAMLQDMGIAVWLPAPATTPQATPAAAPADAAQNTKPAPPRAQRPSAAEPAAQPASADAAAPAPAPDAPPTAGAVYTLRAPQRLYADAAVPAEAAPPPWLLVVDLPAPGAPQAGDVRRLLDNMLRALRLQGDARVWLSTLERAAPGRDASAAHAAAPEALAHAIAQAQPAVVLLLGLAAARAALGRSEHLGRLRQEAHQLHGVPAVVTYDPAFLLRSPQSKAGAWADLCRAAALAGHVAVR